MYLLQSLYETNINQTVKRFVWYLSAFLVLEDNNLSEVRRPFSLSKEELGAKEGEEEEGQNWRIQSNFFYSELVFLVGSGCSHFHCLQTLSLSEFLLFVILE